MPDIYEIEGPGGVFEIESDHEPTQSEIAKAVRVHSDASAAREQERLTAEAGPTSGAVGRFAAGAAEMLNPVTLAKSVYQTVRHPIDTASNMIAAQQAQWDKGEVLAGEGRTVEALGHKAAAFLPIVGPIAADIGEQAGQGDVAGALGKTAGLLTPFAADKAFKVRRVSQATRRAPVLEQQAVDQVAQRVLAPGNPAYKGRAQAVAPEVLARKLTGGRDELRLAADEGMAEAATRIDDAVQAQGGLTAPVPAQEVITELQKSIRSLQDSTGKPYSDRAAARIKALEKRVLHVRSLGGKKGTVRYDDLKGLRDESYSIADEARGFEKQGNRVMSDEGWAARETGGGIRAVFARRSPATAAANADYTFWKTLDEILDPAIGRPKVTAPTQGVTGGARTVGAVTGQMFGGKAGAFVGSVVIPWLKERMTDSSWQLADAQSKMRLAAAMRSGDVGTMRSAMTAIAKYGRATTPTGFQTQPAGASQR